MLCSAARHRGQVEEECLSGSIWLRQERRKEDFLALSCANSLWVCHGSSSSVSSMCGGGLFRMLLSGMVAKCCRTD